MFRIMCATRTIAFSKAALVMMSRGRMFFSTRFLKAGPTESHSSNFSLYSAGKEASPGRVIPSASAALAIVFAVYIWRTKVNGVKTRSYHASIPLHRHQVRDRRGERYYNVLSQPLLCDHPAGIYHTTGTPRRHQAVVLPHKIRAG